MKKALLSLIAGLLSLTMLSQQLKWAKMYPAFQTYSYPEQIEVSNTFHVAFSGIKALPSNPSKNKGMFLNYMDSLGNVLWTSDFACDSSCRPAGLAFDKKGNVFIAGVFSSAVNIDGTNYFLNDSTAFVIKYNSVGIKKIVKMFPGVKLKDVSVDGSGNLIMLAAVSDTTVIYNQTLTPSKLQDAAIIQVDSIGNFTSLIQIKGDVIPLKIRVSENDNLYVYGRHRDTLHVLSYYANGTVDFYGDFVLKMTHAANVLGFNHTFLNMYTNSKYFYLGKNERIIVSGDDGGPHGTWGGFEIFDSVLTRVYKTGMNYCQKSSPAVIIDTTGFWTHLIESHYKGDYYQPDSVWAIGSLSKGGHFWETISRDTMNLYSTKNIITADANSDLYISNAVPPGKTFTIQGTVLTNTNTTLSTFFIAKYSSQINYVGIKDNTSSISEFNIFPNPVTDELNIVYRGTDKGPIQIKIYNILGQTIHSDEFKKSGNDLITKYNLGDVLSKGIYFVSVSGAQGILTKKIVKK